MSVTRSSHFEPRYARAQHGISLVEVLVTVLVLSIGVLGVSGLGAFGKRATFEAVQRSTAAELAYALLEEMRANKAALTTVYLIAGELGRGSLGAEPATTCDSLGAGCTAAEFATHSLWAWERMLDSGWETAGGNDTGGLLDATACIAGPAGGGAGVYSVTIVWRGTTEMTDPAVNVCGAAGGLYGGAGEFRRMAVVQSYIDPTI
jgi:type IV pilus assembly protein PilV